MTKKFKDKCIKLNWNFQRGGGGGLSFWNFTLLQIREVEFKVSNLHYVVSEISFV